jgi:NTE family protein
MMEHKIGLALGGGGARGSYQIGVLKALHDEGILKNILNISGTSIGAINTLMVMANLTFEKMIELWERIDNSQIYGQGLDRYKLDKQGLFSIQELYEKLSKEISLSEIRASKIQGYATAAKIHKGSRIEQVLIHRMEKEVFHLNDFKDPHRAVLASASIPVLFGSVDIDDDKYVDGGAKDNCPIEPLLNEGCDVIIAVPIDGYFHPKKYDKENILLINIESKKLFNFIPYDILDFKPDAVKNKVEYGYQMGKFMVSKLKGLGLIDGENKFSHFDGFQLISISKEEEKGIKAEVNSWI